MFKRRTLTIAIALAVAAIAATIAYADLTAGTKAPNFTLPTVDGKSFTLANSFKDKPQVVVLDLWATWCPPCRAEIPHLINIQKTFKGKDVTIVGVSIDEKLPTVQDFVKQQGVNYTVLHDSMGDKTARLYQIRGVPTTYIIDTKGVIRYIHSGFPRNAEEGKAEAAQIEKEIRSLLPRK